MEIKTINYERVLNLGNYENKKLALFAEVHEGDDVEESISRVMETVERKIREEAHDKYNEQLRQLKQEINSLKQELADLQSQKAQLTAQETDTEIPDGF
ncbi:MAG: hypothetical protein KAF91_31165 [Nostoc sp. TH1S01]|nr:hypothetical protein [Nostoc sp. TH1S01]